MFNLEQLAAFVTAAETGSFSAAARKLGKSTSSVSIAISNLELDLGVSLFDRSCKRPALTQAGEQLLLQARVQLRHAERMRTFANSLTASIEQQLVIGLGPMVPLAIIETVLARLAARFDHTRIQLLRDDSRNLAALLQEKQLDVILQVMQKGPLDIFDYHDAGALEWVFVCSPDHELADVETISMDTLSFHRQVVLDAMQKHPIWGQVSLLSSAIWVVTDHEDLLRLVEQGLAWALLPKVLYLEHAPHGSLIRFVPQFQLHNYMTELEFLTLNQREQGPALRYLCQQLARLGLGEPGETSDPDPLT